MLELNQLKLTLEEVKALQEELLKKEQELLKDKKEAKKQKRIRFNQFLMDHKDVIMQLVEHIDECDEHNGFLSDNKEVYCPACHLKEIVNGEWHLHSFDVSFKVDIKEVEEEL